MASASSSSAECRHQPLSQYEAGGDGDDPIDYVVDENDENTPTNSHKSKLTPLEIGDENDVNSIRNNQSNNVDGGDSHKGFVVQQRPSPPGSIITSTLFPILNLIAENEEKRSQQEEQQHRYQHVIGEDCDDDGHDIYHDDELDDEDKELGLDGIVAVRTTNPVALQCGDRSSTTFFYRVIIALLVVLFAVAFFVPKQKHRRHHGRHPHNHHGSSAYARTCKVDVFHNAADNGGNVHSWQEFRSEMNKDSNQWCRADHNTKQDKNAASTCSCTNRVRPNPKHDTKEKKNIINEEKKWEFNVNQNIVSLNQNKKQGKKNWDVVFLGDERIARWHGMEYGLAQPALAENAQVFDSYFTPSSSDESSSSSSVLGLALGVTDNECPHLQYQLQEPYSTAIRSNPGLQATGIWWIGIGSNDVTQDCSYRGILAGIVAIVSLLQSLCPHSTVVINSILPPPPSLSSSLWLETVQPLNEALQCYVAGHEYEEHVDFLDVTDLFWDKSGGIRNETLFDASHPEETYPNALGYQVWGQAIVDKIEQIRKN